MSNPIDPDPASKFVSALLKQKGGIFTLPEEVSLETLVSTLGGNDIFATVVDRAPVFSKETLLHAIYQSCQFPATFGFNWDALYDCLLDFSWIPQQKVVLIFKDLELLKIRQLEGFNSFMEILSDITEELPNFLYVVRVK